MLWKQKLRTLEKAEAFDEAIIFLEGIIKEKPNDIEPYIFMLYLLADLVIEPHHNLKYATSYENKKYKMLAKKYFDESCSKFAHHTNKSLRTQYLYYVGLTAVFGWYLFGIHDIGSQMIKQAQQEDPCNPVYRLGEYGNKELAEQFLDPNSHVRKMLADKGAIGDYLIRIHESWAHHPDMHIEELRDKDKEREFVITNYAWLKK